MLSPLTSRSQLTEPTFVNNGRRKLILELLATEVRWAAAELYDKASDLICSDNSKSPDLEEIFALTAQIHRWDNTARLAGDRAALT